MTEMERPAMTCGGSQTAFGFLLLAPNPKNRYRGIDRQPFEPLLIDGEMDPNAELPRGASQVWMFYAPGWRRDAYRLYEENSVLAFESLYLLVDLKIAYQIKQVIEPHLGPYEVVACEVWPSTSGVYPEARPDKYLLGYDVAYCGGDFYSALYNGLFGADPDSASGISLSAELLWVVRHDRSHSCLREALQGGVPI